MADDVPPKGVASWAIIDCLDPERLSAFWSRLLGVDVASRRGPYVFLQRSSDGGVGIGLQKVDEPKRGKNRVHLDLFVDDVAALARFILELGGSRVPGYEAGGFLVMADPEGNEFCVLPTSDFEMDDQGNVGYLKDLEL